ncbi:MULTISPECIES: hypothetical protein [Sphingomonas]|uniref:hypothetical protein n=1 Tax=Sphingomonas TaxID=13687 RepID=UPI0013E29773|nr:MULTISPECIES: hypothetical protein [Sphingomonas]
MVNCAMMGVDWRDLYFWQYGGMLAEWNARHSGEKPAPDPEKIDMLRAAMKAHMH